MPTVRRRTIPAALALASALPLIGLSATSATAAPTAPARSAAPVVPLDRPVYIDHVQTGVQLVPDGWNTASDDEVQGYPLAIDSPHENNYRWKITVAPGGDGYRIRNLASRRCLTADKTTRLTLVWQRGCDEEDDGQRWGFSTSNVPRGAYTIFPLGNRAMALAPHADPWVWPGGDWFTRLDDHGPYHNQYWRVRAASG